MAAPRTGVKSLKDYLKKYESSDVIDKKKKKKKPSKPEAKGVLVVDEDPVWQKQVIPEEEENEDDSAEERPVVDEDIEVKRMRRLEEIKARRAQNAIAEDGSGWVTLPTNRENTRSYISPPRRQRTRNDSPSPEPGPRRTVSDRAEADMSPPRRRKRHYTPSPEAKPNRNQAEPSGLESDLSPPRKRKARNDSPSPEPEGKAPKRLSEDLSPPRRRNVRQPSPESSRKRSDSVELDGDLSLPRRKRDLHGSPVSDVKRKSNDLSPPRRRRYHSPSPEPGRKPSKFSDSNADLSPPRRNMNAKVSRNSDLSPQRKTADSQRSSDNVSRSSNFDISPPRKPRRESPPPQTSKEQRKTGLISGKDIGSEYRKKKEDERLRFKNMDSELTGQNAEAVYRDKSTGKRISKEEHDKSKQKKVEKPKEIKLEWGKGLAQKREAEARLQELELEKEKPFARTRDDPELDKMMKERVRWGDPMAHLVKRKQHETSLLDLGDDDRMKESGFVIPQSIPKHSWLTRGLEAAPNRYGIKPGRHWDGVDRSTGYEKNMFKKTNEKKATEIEAYLWAVSDM